jgi:hypothetical protein
MAHDFFPSLTLWCLRPIHLTLSARLVIRRSVGSGSRRHCKALHANLAYSGLVVWRLFVELETLLNAKQGRENFPFWSTGTSDPSRRCTTWYASETMPQSVMISLHRMPIAGQCKTGWILNSSLLGGLSGHPSQLTGSRLTSLDTARGHTTRGGFQELVHQLRNWAVIRHSWQTMDGSIICIWFSKPWSKFDKLFESAESEW